MVSLIFSTCDGIAYAVNMTEATFERAKKMCGYKSNQHFLLGKVPGQVFYSHTVERVDGIQDVHSSVASVMGFPGEEGPTEMADEYRKRLVKLRNRRAYILRKQRQQSAEEMQKVGHHQHEETTVALQATAEVTTSLVEESLQQGCERRARSESSTPECTPSKHQAKIRRVGGDGEGEAEGNDTTAISSEGDGEADDDGGSTQTYTAAAAEIARQAWLTKRPSRRLCAPEIPSPGIDALLAAGIALDLSMKARTVEATSAALAAPSQQQKQLAAYNASGLLRSAATAPASGHELQLQARTKRLPGPAIKGRASAPAAPDALELLANIDVEDKPFISTRRQPQAPSITLRPTGLPVLPDLELISTGPAGVVKILLQVIHLLHLPCQLKIGVLKYARGLLSSPGTYGRDFMDVLYTYLQVGCEHGDVGSLEYVFSEICGSDSIETLELLHKDLSALQARLDVQVGHESSLPLLEQQDEGAGGVEEFRGEGNMHLVSATEAAAMKD